MGKDLQDKATMDQNVAKIEKSSNNGFKCIAKMSVFMIVKGLHINRPMPLSLKDQALR